MQYQKVKSVSKETIGQGPALESLILKTLKICSDVVGSTLGPGGRSVIIERQEEGLPPMVTKDGVTVFKNLGFDSASAHVLMEAARESAQRTAADAGDGPQPLWSEILTPTGFVKMGDIRPGMRICGTNGSIQEVVEVFHKGQKEIVKVTFSADRVVECCEDHLWSVTTSWGKTEVLPLKEIMKDYKSISEVGHDQHKYYTPRTEVELGSKNQKLPLDPYLVGLLIGDGSLGDSGTIELSLGLKKEHILEKLVLPEGIEARSRYDDKKHYFRVKIVGKTPDGRSIRDFVDQIGLRNSKSDTKFIPQDYLLSSRKNRTALLQGLIDTDGHINVRGSFEFSTVSPQLAKDFIFLGRSLGKTLNSWTYHRKEGDDAYGKKDVYRVTETKGRLYGNAIQNIERTGKFTEMRCIKVSNPDNLYITDDFIVTHNTTTGTILAEAIVRHTMAYCKANPKVSPQRVVRLLEKTFKETIEPSIRAKAMPTSLNDEAGRNLLLSVAKVSANGDIDLAKAVLDCFDLCGDDGNVTLIEASGPSKYVVDHLDGFPINKGYDDVGKFYQVFINDIGRQVVALNKPVYILYHGRLSDIYTALTLFEKIGEAAATGEFSHNVVFVATGFSEIVLAHLATNFQDARTPNIYPLVAPLSPMATSQYDFLADLAALTGGTIFDPLNAPLENAELNQLGHSDFFESARYRSTVLGFTDEEAVLNRADQLKTLLASGSMAQLDTMLVQERLGKLTGGIAQLRIVGASAGELREKRDRAEDAICAVRGALKNGALPGGGWTLLRLRDELTNLGVPVLIETLGKALQEPIDRLFSNAGYTAEERDEVTKSMKAEKVVYDLLEGKFVDPVAGGVLDSVPAVLEAIRNSLSIASQIGTCGGISVFKRDSQLERQDARDTADFIRNSTVNEADLRP